MKIILFAVFLFSTTLGIAEERPDSGEYGSFGWRELPQVPSRCTLAIIGPIKMDENLKQAISEAGSWKSFLIRQGLTFTNGGFAIYMPSTSTLAVASNYDDLDLAELMFSPTCVLPPTK